MKEKILEIVKKYNIYIMTFIIIILVIIIGFMYASNSTKIKPQEPIIKEENEETKKEVKKIKVDIKGMVKKEGVYELEENSRVIDVIKASGGLKKEANTSLINLSKKITDEMVIIIYSDDEIEEFKKENKIEKYTKIENKCICPDEINNACIDSKEIIEEKKENNENQISEEKESNSLVSINTATKEELLTITGIGESKAKSIIEYRQENGMFNKIEDIKNVSGIGDSLFEKIKDYITT